ncbi:MAG: LysM domain-containing protein [Parvularculaceae bacterium]|nr:LysM peptidoglycan-binding domain-containing protein [Parvularculaceae bacterium]
MLIQGNIAMRTDNLVFAGISMALLAASGCAVQSGGYAGADDPYFAAVYTGAPRPDAPDLYSTLVAPEQLSSNGVPFELVSYAGIEGARRAHALYAKADAEALDGRCETRIRPAKTESMIDIAELCDVPLDLLVEFNPGAADYAYDVSESTLRIPGGIEPPKGVAALSDQLVRLNEFQSGDTIEKIAFRNNVPVSTIADLNPGVDWSAPQLSGSYLTPARAAQVSRPAAPPASASWEGYSPITGADANSAYVGLADGLRHAPYRQRLVGTYARAEGYYPEPRLSVESRYVKPGGKIRVTASGVRAGREIVFSAGGRTVSATADANGVASAAIRVKKNTQTSNVVVTGRERGSSDTLFSETVGVVALDAEPGDR